MSATFERAAQLAYEAYVTAGGSIGSAYGDLSEAERDVARAQVRAVLSALAAPDADLATSINDTIGHDLCSTEVEIAVERGDFLSWWRQLLEEVAGCSLVPTPQSAPPPRDPIL